MNSYIKNCKYNQQILRVTIGLALAVIFAISCDQSPLAIGVVKNSDPNCSYCHGNEDNAAPPSALSEDNELGIGAHQAHLKDGTISKAVPCEECHIVPELSNDPHHLQEGPDDHTSEVVFGDFSKTGDLEPSWNRDDAKCVNTYCHGASLEDGLHTEPIWTLVDQSQNACDSCHGSPPQEAHSQDLEVTQCFKCHPSTVDENGDILVSDGFHINGESDTLSECYACHGTEDVNDAPPLSLNGATETTDIAVGAHQVHLKDGKIAKAVPCEECHIVPEKSDEPDHLADGPDDLLAEVVFGPLSASEDLSPVWNRNEVKCTNTYCHGASLEGGLHIEPIWTVVDESQVTCESCHGNPPALPHPQEPIATDCMACHPDVVDANGEILVAEGKHIDGVIDTTTECFSCHGTEGINDAPPFAMDGSEDTNEIGVGAHQSHLLDGIIAKAMPCEECHIVPEEDDDEDHLADGPDDLTAEVVFGPISMTDDLSPVWDRDTVKCTNTYCHGSSLKDGNNTEPVWTTVDQTQNTCESCHGNPPLAPHASRPDCVACHPATVDVAGDIIISGEAHLNGVIDVEAACYECHGTTEDGAPPTAIDGSTATTNIGVGAHQSHVVAGVYSLPIPCTECHVVPENTTDPGHLDSDYPAEVFFGPLATTGLMTPVWNGILPTPTCSNSYCHGSGPTTTGGTNTEPIWTQVDGSQVSCTSCHGSPPALPHLQETQCQYCHPKTCIVGETLDLPGGFHVNGIVEVF